MARSVRINIAAFACLALGALATPLSAEEITVTVPPDSPQQTAVSKPADPPSSLPSFTGGGKLNATPVADSGNSTEQTPPPTTPAATTVKHKTKDKKAAAASKAPTTTGSTTPSETGSTAAPAADKTKQASKASPCKDADEPTCGANKLCKWVEGTTDAAGKTTKSRCRSLAMLKKEAAKKTAKAGGSEVLPWAANGSAATSNAGPASASTGEAPAATTKPAKKTKTASAKKPTKPKAEIAPPVPSASDGGGDQGPAPTAPDATAAPSAPDPQ